MKPYNTKDIDGKEANEFYAYKKDNYGNGIYTTKTSFKVTEIGYDDADKINKLTIVDNKGNIRFQVLTKEEQDKIISLMQELSKLLNETNTDRDKFYGYYKVSSDAEMTIPQLEDGIAKLKKKVGE
jgi:hypothetical protein